MRQTQKVLRVLPSVAHVAHRAGPQDGRREHGVTDGGVAAAAQLQDNIHHTLLQTGAVVKEGKAPVGVRGVELAAWSAGQ
eukprot:7101911-Pyramimonas_sp.AAC.1